MSEKEKKDLTEFLNANTKEGSGTWVKDGNWYVKTKDDKK